MEKTTQSSKPSESTWTTTRPWSPALILGLSVCLFGLAAALVVVIVAMDRVDLLLPWTHLDDLPGSPFSGE